MTPLSINARCPGSYRGVAGLLHDAQVTSEAMDRSTTEFDRFLSEIAVGLEALTFEEQQKVLRLIVEKITYENGKARVEIVIPPAPVESEGATAKLHNRLPEGIKRRRHIRVSVHAVGRSRK